MRTDSGSSGDASPSVSSVSVGPRTAAFLCSCAGAATLALLGAAWVSSPWLGLPLGAWVVGAATGTAHLVVNRRRLTGLRLDRPPAPRRVELLSGVFPNGTSHYAAAGARRDRTVGFALPVQNGTAHAAMAAPPAPESGVAAGPLPSLAAASDFAAGGFRQLSAAREKLNRWCNRRLGGPGPLRIGVDLSRADADALMNIASEEGRNGLRIEWAAIDAGRDDRADLARFGLDALIRARSNEALRIVTPEAAGHDASWYDWASRMPLSYIGVFPHRVDAAVATLPGCDLSVAHDACLVARLAEAAAALGRSDHRLRTGARSRRALPGETATDRAAMVEGFMLSLAATLRRIHENNDHAPTPTARAASRVVSAWLATTDTELFVDERRGGIEVAARLIPHEPEVLLRLAAARFASYDDEAGLDSLRHAVSLLRETQERPLIDPAPFLASELAMASGGDLALGRLLSGMCLVWATAPDDRLEYLRDDLLDDLNYSGLLIGRDQDRALVQRVIRELEVMRPGRYESASEPPAAAAA